MAAGAFNKVISFVEWRNDTAGGKLKIEKMSNGGWRFIDAAAPGGFVYIPAGAGGGSGAVTGTNWFDRLHALLEALS